MPQNGSGFGGGLVIGAGLGLAWSPCVGPIMASVITLALNQQVDAAAVAVTLAFSLGTALPMAAIMLGGRQLTRRLGWFQANAGRIQQVLGGLLVLTGLAIFLGWDRQIQILLLTWFPHWELALTGWEPRPGL
jgi:cytochrome c biogenesis protein CcdA